MRTSEICEVHAPIPEPDCPACVRWVARVAARAKRRRFRGTGAVLGALLAILASCGGTDMPAEDAAVDVVVAPDAESPADAMPADAAICMEGEAPPSGCSVCEESGGCCLMIRNGTTEAYLGACCRQACCNQIGEPVCSDAG